MVGGICGVSRSGFGRTNTVNKQKKNVGDHACRKDEYEQSQNGSVTVRTNLAGGRGSIGSNLDDNNSHIYEEIKQNGGRLSPHAVLSQRFFDQQSFYGFRRDLTRVQNQKFGCTSSMSQAPDN